MLLRIQRIVAKHARQSNGVAVPCRALQCSGIGIGMLVPSLTAPTPTLHHFNFVTPHLHLHRADDHQQPSRSWHSLAALMPAVMLSDSVR